LAGVIFLGEKIGYIQGAGMVVAAVSLAALARSSARPSDG
jgi:drug/metabolite transporter (DMT)-like permease